MNQSGVADAANHTDVLKGIADRISKALSLELAIRMFLGRIQPFENHRRLHRPSGNRGLPSRV